MISEAFVSLPAVLASGVANMVIGAVWYSPMLFAKPWIKLNGFGKDGMAMKNGMAKTYTIMFVMSLVMAWVLGRTVFYASATTLSDGLMVGLITWLGFVATSMLNGYLFGKKPFALYLIDSGYYLVSMMVMATILTLWV